MYNGLLLLTLFVLIGCGRPENTPSNISTNLGREGNARVAERFHDYVKMREQGGTGCSARGNSGHRILLTGFGKFSGSPANISGLVATSLQQSKMWKPSLVSGDLFKFNELVPQDIVLTDIPGNSFGGNASQRTITYDGIEYEICSLLVEVQWDLAAALILYEAEKFQPNFLLMTGLGGYPLSGRLEFGGLNLASKSGGYDKEGEPSGNLNKPIDTYILPREDRGVKNPIPFSWNNKQIAERVERSVAQMNTFLQLGRDESFDISPERQANSRNNYICNNIGYVVMNGSGGTKVRLAGEDLVLEPKLPANLKVGFYHFPLSTPTDLKTVWAWGHLIFSIVAAAT